MDFEEELVCSYSAEGECLTGAVEKRVNNKNHIKENNLLITNDKLNINLKKTKKLDYFILNLSGQIVERNIYNDFNYEHLELNLSNLNSGIYFINVNTDDGSIVQIFRIVR